MVNSIISDNLVKGLGAGTFLRQAFEFLDVHYPRWDCSSSTGNRVTGNVAMGNDMRTYVLSNAITTGIGISSVAFNAAAQSLLQLGVPDRMRGRIMSLHTLLFLGTTPVGGLATGWLAERWGIRATLGIEATICTTGIAAALGHRAVALLRLAHLPSK